MSLKNAENKELSEEEVLHTIEHAISGVIFTHDFATDKLEITVERARYLAKRVHRNLLSLFGKKET